MFFDLIKSYFLSLVIAGLFWLAGYLLGSNSLVEYLDKNLVTVLLQLLAINYACVSVVLSRLRQLLDINSSANFDQPIMSLKVSIIEQISLIIISVILMLIKESQVIPHISWLDHIFDYLSIVCLVHAVTILYDTSKGIFLITTWKHES